MYLGNQYQREKLRLFRDRYKVEQILSLFGRAWVSASILTQIQYLTFAIMSRTIARMFFESFSSRADKDFHPECVEPGENCGSIALPSTISVRCTRCDWEFIEARVKAIVDNGAKWPRTMVLRILEAARKSVMVNVAAYSRRRLWLLYL